MLTRRLEPEVMDTLEEARDYDAMDHGAVNDRFVADFLALHGPCRGGEVLDVGTGTAQIPIRLCQMDQHARVLAIDLSGPMLAVARENVRKAALGSRITLRQVDARTIAEGAGHHEAVVSNSIVHHIPEPGSVLAELVRLVAPGGSLFVRDLTRPASREELERLVAMHAGGESDHARAMFADSLHAALTVEEVQELVAALGLPPEGVTMTSDRHWTWGWKRP